MENASKALMMAGGILLSIIVIGMLTMMFNSIREIPQGQEELAILAQIEQFNKEYIAYDKERTYGTDIITLLRKALDYNRKCDEDGDERDKVDIRFTLKKVIKSYAKEYVYIPDTTNPNKGYMDTLTYGQDEDSLLRLVDNDRNLEYELGTKLYERTKL